MRDFKDSYRQKHWEHSLDRYARAKLALKIYAGKSDESLSEAARRAKAYWLESIAAIEAEYPSLRNHSLKTEPVT